MKTRVIYVAVILLSICLVTGIIGCSTSAPAASQQTTTQTSASKTLTIGVMSPLTGPAAQWGIATRRATEMAVDAVNAKGGLKVGKDIYQLKMIAYDNKMSGTEAVAACNRLIHEDSVKYIVGFGSSPVIAAGAVTEPNKVLFMVTSFASGIIGKNKPYTFRGQYTGTECAEGIYGYITSNMKQIKTIALLGNDDDTGKASSQQDGDIAVSKGLTIIAKEYVPRGTTDFYPTLTKLIPANPDLIDIDSLAPADLALFIKQARERGYTGTIMGNSSSDIPAIVRIAGAAAAEGYMQEGLNYRSSVATQEQQKFYDLCIQKYGAPFDPLVGCLYQMTLGITSGIEAAQSIETDKVAAAIPDTTFESLGVKLSWGGTQRYGIKHQIVSPIYVLGVKNGEAFSLGKYMPPVP